MAFIAIIFPLYRDKNPLDHDTNGWDKLASAMADTRHRYRITPTAERLEHPATPANGRLQTPC